MKLVNESNRKESSRSKTTYLPLICSFVFLVSAHAGEFTHASSFDSVASFVATAKAFRPAETKIDIARLFTIAEMGQPEDPKTGTPIVPENLDSCKAIWEGARSALVFAVATPKTEATRSAVGVLFLLSKAGHQWIISDLHKFTAIGKYADITFELTSSVGVGYELGEEGMRPIVTIKEGQGGHGYGYQLSASYTLNRKVSSD